VSFTMFASLAVNLRVAINVLMLSDERQSLISMVSLLVRLIA